MREHVAPHIGLDEHAHLVPYDRYHIIQPRFQHICQHHHGHYSEESGVELIVLAGFLVAIPPMIVEAYPNKIINIHPSLIPSFCGVGYYGLHVHEKALARGVRVTGATVHFVDTGTDTGPIILQKAVKIKSDDTPEVLQRRVMEKAEWKILPKAINLIANGKVKVVDGRVEIEEYDTEE